MTKRSSEDLQKVFHLIEEGKSHEAAGDQWSAVDCFTQSQLLLAQLSDMAALEQQSSGNDDHEHHNEHMKIVNLYKRQSREYLHRARKCLLEALTTENEQDEKYREVMNSEEQSNDNNHQPKFLSLTQAEAEKRNQSFIALFSQETQAVVVATTEGDQEMNTAEQKQSSLEERLMELNKSIPYGFKTTAEKMMEINQGLRRLGLTLYTEDSQSANKIEPPKSEHEQVADIIAQAKDEVQFNIDGDEPKTTDGHDNDDDHGNNDDDDDDDHDDDNDDEEEASTDDNDILLHRKVIRKQVVDAQIKLANLVAWLDKEPVALDHAKAKDEVELTKAKKALTDAKRHLGKALKLWEEEEK